jgi:hypothetical protein
LLRNREGTVRLLPSQEIEEIREIWNETLKHPNPPDAIKIIKASAAIADVAGIR